MANDLLQELTEKLTIGANDVLLLNVDNGDGTFTDYKIKVSTFLSTLGSIDTFYATTGTSTAYVIASANFDREDGAILRFIPDETCGASPTMAENGESAANIKIITETGAQANAPAGAFLADERHILEWDDTNSCFVLHNQNGYVSAQSLQIYFDALSEIAYSTVLKVSNACTIDDWEIILDASDTVAISLYYVSYSDWDGTLTNATLLGSITTTGVIKNTGLGSALSGTDEIPSGSYLFAYPTAAPAAEGGIININLRNRGY